MKALKLSADRECGAYSEAWGCLLSCFTFDMVNRGIKSHFAIPQVLFLDNLSTVAQIFPS